MRWSVLSRWQDDAARWPVSRAATVGLGVLLVLAGGYWLRVHDTRAAYRQGSLLEAQQMQALQARQSLAEGLVPAEAALIQEQHTLQEARWRLSGGASMSDLLDQLALTGRSHGLLFEQLDIGQEVQAVGYRQIPLQMQVSGSYAGLRAWLDEWLQQVRLLQVVRAQLEPATGRPGLLHLHLQVHALEAGEELPAPASLADEPARQRITAPLLDPFAPWSTRRRAQEGLIGVPLEQLEMVGSLSRAGSTHALVRWAGRVYRVAEGDHLGREEGEVVKVDPDQVEIRERLFNDAAWQERSSYLTLSRGSSAGSTDDWKKRGDRSVGALGVDAGTGDDGLQR